MQKWKMRKEGNGRICPQIYQGTILQLTKWMPCKGSASHSCLIVVVQKTAHSTSMYSKHLLFSFIFTFSQTSKWKILKCRRILHPQSSLKNPTLCLLITKCSQVLCLLLQAIFGKIFVVMNVNTTECLFRFSLIEKKTAFILLTLIRYYMNMQEPKGQVV